MKAPSGSLRLAFVLIGLILAPRAQAADLELQGISLSQGKTEVMLIQKSTGTGRWVSVGQTFAGYTVTACDSQTGQLTLAKDHKTLVLNLKTAAVQAATVVTPPIPEDKKAMLNNLRQLSAAADQYFLENGVKKVDASQLIGPNTYIKAIKPVAGETYTGFSIEQGKPIRIKTASGFEMEYSP
jgi:hypothetical protein